MISDKFNYRTTALNLFRLISKSITLLAILVLFACTSNGNRGSYSHSTPSPTTSNTRLLSSTPNGVTVASYGNGKTRSDAEQAMLRRAIKEVVPSLAGNIYDSPELTKAIKHWVSDQKELDYEDLVKRRAFDIDQQQGGEYFLEGKLILNYAYLKSQVNRFVDHCRRTKKCGGRLSVYITPDASVALSAEDIKLARSFMYSLQEQFINAGFEIKKSNQQKEAQYQIKLIDLQKIQSGLNINFHFTVEALDNRAAGAVFATKKGSASASLAVGDQMYAQNQALKRSAKQVGASLTHQIITRKQTNEIIFYVQGGFSSQVEQQLAEGLVSFYGISLNDIINIQNTSNNNFTSWSFEVPASSRTTEFDFKRSLMQLQRRILNASNPNIKVTKAGSKWSSYDDANPPPEFQRGPIADVWTLQVEQLIRQGKLDRPYGSGNNAVDTIRARLNEQPGDLNAQQLLQDIATRFTKEAQRALQQNLIPQAKRYAKRAQTIWPEQSNLKNINQQINNQRPLAPSNEPKFTENTNLIKANPNEGKNVLQQGQYWAILIANQIYDNVESLATPHKDVAKLKQILTDNYGFSPSNITVIKDGTQKKIRDELNRTLEYVNENDSLLIFYAGHGYQDRGLGFWVPKDGISPLAEGESTAHMSTWISNSSIQDIVNNNQAKHVLLISDSCFAGTFKPRTRGFRGLKRSANNLEYIYKLASLTSRTALTSGDLQPVQDGGGNGHSLFAYHLFQILKEDKTISAKDLFAKIHQPIAATQIQDPQYFVMDKINDKGGDFIFYKQ